MAVTVNITEYRYREGTSNKFWRAVEVPSGGLYCSQHGRMGAAAVTTVVDTAQELARRAAAKLKKGYETGDSSVILLNIENTLAAGDYDTAGRAIDQAWKARDRTKPVPDDPQDFSVPEPTDPIDAMLEDSEDLIVLVHREPIENARKVKALRDAAAKHRSTLQMVESNLMVLDLMLEEALTREVEP